MEFNPSNCNRHNRITHRYQTDFHDGLVDSKAPFLQAPSKAQCLAAVQRGLSTAIRLVLRRSSMVWMKLDAGSHVSQVLQVIMIVYFMGWIALSRVVEIVHDGESKMSNAKRHDINKQGL